jgi:transcriptional regulator with XRE-family HTH domain
VAHKLTIGARALCDTPGSAEAIAGRVGASKMSVSRWRRGVDTPGARARTVLFAVLKIPPDAWDRYDTGTAAPAAAAARPAARAPTPTGPALPPPAAFVDDVRALDPSTSTIEQVDRLIGRIRTAAATPGLMPAILRGFQQAEVAALALRDRIEQNAKLLEDRVLREHPAWIRVRRALARLAERYPGLADDLERELGTEGA